MFYASVIGFWIVVVVVIVVVAALLGAAAGCDAVVRWSHRLIGECVYIDGVCCVYLRTHVDLSLPGE